MICETPGCNSNRFNLTEYPVFTSRSDIRALTARAVMTLSVRCTICGSPQAPQEMVVDTYPEPPSPGEYIGRLGPAPGFPQRGGPE